MEFIWVIGLSAVGKRWFIKNVLTGSLAGSSRQKLGISMDPETVVASGSGFCNVSDRDFSPQKLLSDLEARAASQVLIKFQNQYDRRDQADKRLPFSVVADLVDLADPQTSQHRIIALWAEPAEHVIRTMNKLRDRPSRSKGYIARMMMSNPPKEAEAQAHLVKEWKNLLIAVQRVEEEVTAKDRVLRVQILDASDEDYRTIPLVWETISDVTA